jgi:hypothetical protein
MENLQINQGIKFLVSDGKGVIGTADPSGSQGISKGASETGFYIQSSVDYTLWFYDGSAWAAHQSIDVSDANYSEGFAFAWEDNTAAYIKTADASHEVYVFGRSGDLKVDSTPGDSTQGADSVFDGTGSLSITSIEAQNDYTEGLSVASDGTVTFDRTDNNSAYQLKFEGTNITIGKNGDDTITLTGGDEFTSPLTTDGDLFIQSGSADSRLGIGSDGQYLSVASGSPVWADLTSVSIGSAKQVPFMDNGATDLSYNSKLTYNGSSLISSSTNWNVPGLHVDSTIDSNYTKIYAGSLSGALDGVDWTITRIGTTGLGIQTTSNKSLIFSTNSGTQKVMQLKTDGNVEVGQAYNTTALGARFGIKGEGSTSATSAFVVKNSSNSTLFEIKDDGSMTGVLGYNSSGIAEFNTANQNTFAGTYYNGTVGVFGYVNDIAAGARAALIAGYGHDIDKYVDRANIFGNGNKVHASTDSSHSSYASLGLKEGGTIIGSSNYGNGSGIQVIGASNQVWGSTSFGTMSMALGNTIKIGRSDNHAEDSYGFGKNLTMDGRLSSSNIKDVRNIMMIGYNFSANNAIHDENTPMILFGTAGGRPTMAMMADPAEQTLPMNLLMGSTHVAYNSGTAYPLQTGMGSGCIIMHGENNRTKAPSVDIPDAITMYAGDRSYDGTNAVVGGKGLIVKGENSGRTYISERVGINVSHNSAKTSQINEDVEAGLHIYGEGNSNATSSVKVENSDGNVAIEVLNDLVVVMPNLPTSSAGLPTGALYNDGGTVKVA